MSLREKLSKQLRLKDIHRIVDICRVDSDNISKEELYALISDDDNHIAYNALWIFTHFSTSEIEWLVPKRDELIDKLLSTRHIGCQRLILTILDKQITLKENIRTDYLDFCLSNINSTKPYGIRSLCLKQAFNQCRLFPELMIELKHEIEMMMYGELSPGLLAARKNILKRIEKFACENM